MSPIAKIHHEGEGEHAQDYLWFWCAGCHTHHRVPVTGPRKWEWNGSETEPTLQPSIKVTLTRTLTDDEQARIMRGEPFTPVDILCHSFVTEGRIQYLNDSTHQLAGQTVPLEPLP